MSESVADVSMRLYKKKMILAPMVRACTLPLRVSAIKHGADTVYTEEIVDHKLLRVKREVNKELGTIDYVHDVNGKKNSMRKHCVLRIHPETEKGRLILQIGTSDAVRALKATQIAIKDIDAVDLNMCCPKHFSVHSGMGVALTRKPEIASDIIKTLRRNLNIPVSCKIRMLDEESGKQIEQMMKDRGKKKKKKRKRQNTDNGTYLSPSKLPSALRDTREFIRNMEAAGACAVAVHMRTASERRKQRAHLETDSLKFLSESVKIPFIVNGDVFTRDDLKRVREILPDCSVMFARGALRNVSVFRKEGSPELPVPKVIEEYLTQCIRFDNVYGNSKYVVQETMKLNKLCDNKNKNWKALMEARTVDEICAAFDLNADTLRKRCGRFGGVVREYEANHVYSDDYFKEEASVVSTSSVSTKTKCE